jgi:hypothetical protein
MYELHVMCMWVHASCCLDACTALLSPPLQTALELLRHSPQLESHRGMMAAELQSAQRHSAPGQAAAAAAGGGVVPLQQAAPAAQTVTPAGRGEATPQVPAPHGEGAASLQQP